MAKNGSQRGRGPAWGGAGIRPWAGLLLAFHAGASPACAEREAWVEQDVRAPSAAGQLVRMTRVRRGTEGLEVQLELRAPPGAGLTADLGAAPLEVEGLMYPPERGAVVKLAPGEARTLWLRFRLGRPLHAQARVHLLDLRSGGVPLDPVVLEVPPVPKAPSPRAAGGGP